MTPPRPAPPTPFPLAAVVLAALLGFAATPPAGAADTTGRRAVGLRTPCGPVLPTIPGSGHGPVVRPSSRACRESDETLRILVFTRTTGFRHESIADARRFFATLPKREGMTATLTEDPAQFNDDELAAYDVVVFVNTTGDVLDETQQGALERFVRSGRGWVGVHSASDTEYTWPWYGSLVGAYFISHPVLPVEVDVSTEDREHPSTAHLPAKFRFTDEIYNFDRNPRADHSILLTVDEAGFIYPNYPSTPSMGADHPIAWSKEFEGGRSFYTNLGHRPETWADPAFREHLLEGIRWAAEPVSWSRIVVSGRARNPLALAVAPDGRVFWVERTGEVRIWNPRDGRVADALRLDVSLEGENGLLGIALDPDFADNRHVYLYYALNDYFPPPDVDPDELPYTGPKGNNVLARFTLRADDTLDPASRVELLRIPSERISGHEGGALTFAADGTLLLSVGDNTDPHQAEGYAPLDMRPDRDRFNALRTSQNPFDLRGKILRLRPDGGIPPGNLFPASGELGRPEIFVMGARNPFRTAVDPATGRLFWGDIGPDQGGDGARGPRGYDEINFSDGPGNHGWPKCIADNIPYSQFDFATEEVGPPFSCAGMIPSLFAYDYVTTSILALGSAVGPQGFTGRSAMAGAVYRKPTGKAPFALPDTYAGDLLMTDWTRDVIAAVTTSPGGELRSVRRVLPFVGFKRPIDMEVGPDGALYVLEYGSGFYGDNADARLSRIEYSEEGMLTPVAIVKASAEVGGAPLAVSFSGVDSYAPGALDEIVAWAWDIDGDGRIDSREPALEHTFTSDGVYEVGLVVTGASGRRSFPATVEIVVGNRPPVVTIDAPVPGTTITAGQVVDLRGRAFDPEDGEIPCDRLTWDIRLGHNAHAHPRYLREGCNAAFVATIPDDHGTASVLFYAVELVYTDQGGANGTPPLTGRASVRLDLAPAAAAAAAGGSPGGG